MTTQFPRITIETRRGGKLRNIGSVPEAAECLLMNWPIHDSAKLKTARQKCLDALDGKETTSECRLAFIEAAKEARILVDYPTRRA
ncbi:MAG: DUF982 domain-containing protein [Phyllobacterium sp.]|jgi:hypothetical protein|uniref:DUF982 domain-containing protein n=1 Tax=Phyllobacterium sp. TaxID=1871046 RepID=UPI0030F3301A